jgi:hypothetical protein
MSKKPRFKFKSDLLLKRAHKKMLNNFETIIKVSDNKSRNGDLTIFFSVKNSDEEIYIKSHFNKIGIKLEQVD